jgi:hypothetical protein
MRRYLGPLLPAGLVGLVACGGGDERPAPAETAAPTATAVAAEADATVAFKLREENGSGISGTARLRGGDNGFTVMLAAKRPRTSGPAHIHNVTCEEYRALKDFDAQLGTVSVALADLVDGKSRTPVDKGPMSEYRTGSFSINVHSYDGGFPVVACGDIPTG